MKFELRAHSAVGLFALFDPLSVPTLLRGRAGPFRNLDEFLAAVVEAAATGDMLTYHADWDGELRLRVHLDEPPDAVGVGQEALRDSLLRVPSGRLVLLGAESIAGDDPRDFSPGQYHPPAGRRGMEVWVPAVDYRVTAYEVGESQRPIPEEIARELKTHNETIAQFQRHTAKVALLTIACVPLALLGVMVAFATRVTLNLAAVAALGFFLGAAWRSVVRRWQSPELQGALARRRELGFAEDGPLPEVIIVLQPLDGPAPAEFNPARLGPGVARHCAIGDGD
jgi:hypothetical protein